MNSSTILSNLNGIYNTMNVNWQSGKQIPININARNENLELSKVYNNDKLRRDIIEVLKKQDGYSDKEYYMIVLPGEETSGGFANSDLNSNWFFCTRSFNPIVPAHELGHCNGLDEFAVNIGVLPSIRRGEADKEAIQKSTSNVMGYSTSGLASAMILKDFYSWQIQMIREKILNRIN